MRLFNPLAVALAISIVGPAPAAGVTRHLTPEQRAGQLIGTTLTGLSSPDELALWVRTRAVGLLVAYRVDLRERESIVAVARRFAAPGLEPLVAADQEGGGVSRLEAVALPSAMALGATGSEELARRAGRFAGCGLRRAGINVNFAPVLDLADPSDGASFRTRSFGSDPARVASLGAAFVRGSLEAGVLPIAKHFPGSGFADADPHREASKSLRSTAEMRAQDLRPFESAIAAGAAGVMTAHVTYPNWEGSGSAPASISPEILGILRREKAFEGLVITDAIQMGGLGSAPMGELAVRAIEAGADIVLAPSPVERDAVYRALLDAIRSGRLTSARLERSVARVARARQRLQDFTGECGPDVAIAEDIAKSAITRIGASMPVDFSSAFFTGGPGEVADWFPASHRRVLAVDPPRTAEMLEPLAMTVACTSRHWVAMILNREQAAFVRNLRKLLPQVRLTLVVAGSPFDAADIEADEYLFTYGVHPAMIGVLRAVLQGEARAPGRLPVAVEGIGAVGEGETDYQPTL